MTEAVVYALAVLITILGTIVVLERQGRDIEGSTYGYSRTLGIRG